MAGHVYARKKSDKYVADMKLIENLKKKMQKDRKNAVIPASVDEFCKIYGKRDKSIAMLSHDQRIAVGRIKGQNLLFAVPGSGKTAVIVARAGYMLHGNHGEDIRPENMVTLTFSRKAAQEMAERYSRIFPEDEGTGPCFKTIHSFCLNDILKPLRRMGYDFPQNIIGSSLAVTDEETGRKRYITINQLMNEVLSVIKEKHKEECGEKQNTACIPNYIKPEEYKTLTSAITYIKNKMLTKEYCRKHNVYFDEYYHVSAADLIEAYDYILHEKYKSCDFDDMLSYAYNGLKDNPGLLQAIRRKYKYWSIDEAQDNSPLQTKLIKLLSEAPNNLFMVGDDDQSIYGFRGAEQMGLLEFGVEPETHIMTMGINYRSNSQIVNVAKAFVDRVPVRADKAMQANSNETGSVVIKSFAEEKQMLNYILKRATKANQQQNIALLSGKKPQTSLAVLYRNNYPAISLAFLLHKHGISFNMGNGIKECFSNSTFLKILGFIEFVINEYSVDTFMKLHRQVGFPGCSKKNSEHLKRMVATHKDIPVYQVYLDYIKPSFPNEKRLHAILDKLDELRNIYKKKSSASCAEEENKSYAMALCITREGKDKNKKNNQDEKVGCGRFSYMLELFSSPDELVKAYYDICNGQEKTENRIPTVDILTMHGSKGLQYDEVILTECVEKRTDEQSDSLNVNSSSDGRRLFYVGMTRAKKRLCILNADTCIVSGKIINYFMEIALICSKLNVFKQPEGDEKESSQLEQAFA